MCFTRGEKWRETCSVFKSDIECWYDLCQVTLATDHYLAFLWCSFIIMALFPVEKQYWKKRWENFDFYWELTIVDFTHKYHSVPKMWERKLGVTLLNKICFTYNTQKIWTTWMIAKFTDANLGKISAQPHTSLYIHIWGFIIQCITSKMYMHN